MGGKVRKGQGLDQVPESLKNLPLPTLPVLDKTSYGILVTGVGGTGVVTIGALLGTAAHIDGRGISVVDQMGFAQKGGPVMTHLRIGKTPEDINAVRLNAGAADLLLGCDLVVSAGDNVLSMLDKDKTNAIVNSHETITGDFTRNVDMRFPTLSLRQRLNDTLNSERLELIESTKLATRLLGDAIASNLFLVGYAWQKGLLPLAEASILEAIELNGVAVEWNQEAFRWGRRAAHDFEAVATLCEDPTTKAIDMTNESLDDFIARRAKDLTAYQNDAYASRYLELVNNVKATEQEKTSGKIELTQAVARYAYKLMAYKDEYEVGRLYSDPAFKNKLNEQFEGNYKLRFNLAPPLLARKDKVTGKPRKMEFGSWLLPMFSVLRKLKFLRGTAIDVFGWTKERKMERDLIIKYEETLKDLLHTLTNDNHTLAVEIACLPDEIRGYGYIKEENVEKVSDKLQKLMECWRNPPSQSEAA